MTSTIDALLMKLKAKCVKFGRVPECNLFYVRYTDCSRAAHDRLRHHPIRPRGAAAVAGAKSDCE